MKVFDNSTCESKEIHNKHYRGVVEPFDVYCSMNLMKEACKANIIKYTMRQGKKEGEEIKDLKKIFDYALTLALHSGIEREELYDIFYDRLDLEEERIVK